MCDECVDVYEFVMNGMDVYECVMKVVHMWMCMHV